MTRRLRLIVGGMASAGIVWRVLNNEPPMLFAVVYIAVVGVWVGVECGAFAARRRDPLLLLARPLTDAECDRLWAALLEADDRGTDADPT